jgi:CelD/BcsL family acetyltransferase involved in cellulose biosynthesis
VSQNLRLDLLQQIPEDAGLREQWNDLVARVDRPQVFYTYEWALAVQRAYGATLHPRIFLAFDEQNGLCGVAALAVDSSNDRTSFLGATTGDYCDFLSLPEHKGEFCDAVLHALKKQGVEDVTFTNLPADSDTAAALERSASRSGYHFFGRTAYVCTQVCLADLERRPGDNQPVLPRRKMVRRFIKAMGRDEPVRLEHARTWDEVRPILPEFMQSHVARFLVTGRISNVARPERRVFLEELAKLLSEPGWLALTRMTSGANNFAWNYGFYFRDTWFWYQPTFDSDLEKYSPGFCLLTKLIEEADGNPALKVVDMGLGAEEYKDRFANQTRETLQITLKSSAARHYREIIRYRSAAIIRKSPRVETAARTMRRQAVRVKERAQHTGTAATFFWSAKRLRDLIWLGEEVFFYEWRESSVSESRSLKLQTVDLNLLTFATSQHVDDPETLAYLVRAAARLREPGAEGYALVDLQGKILHFAWVADFEGFFLSELNAKVDAPASDCKMLCDCWTPAAERGYGYYGRAIALIAHAQREKGKRPWIFSAASNIASIKGLEKAGFERRYSLMRRRVLGWDGIVGKTPKDEPVGAEVPVRIS